MSKLIIFGTSEIAEVAHFYFSKRSDYEVVAFTVDSAFKKDNHFLGLPLVEFDIIENIYPPSRYEMFVALSYAKLNSLRQKKYKEAKIKGYRLMNYLSDRCCNYSDHPFGDNCFILENNTIQPFVKIGNNVTLWSGNHIGHHAEIGDNTFISSHVVISGGVKIGKNCFIGVNATIGDHISVGDHSVIGAGALVLKSAPENSVYIVKSTAIAPFPSSRLPKF